jgi:hypothetical protein
MGVRWAEVFYTFLMKADLLRAKHVGVFDGWSGMCHRLDVV